MTKREAFWMSALPLIRMSDELPKIIHQTFWTGNLPSHLKDNVDRLRAMNPGWEYRFYDDSACEHVIDEFFGEQVLSIYCRINPHYGAARADLFRYLLMYCVGGVYLDIKSYFDRPIEQAISKNDSFIISHWDNKAGGSYPGFGLHKELARWPQGELQQWHIIAAPGHPFLRRVIAKVLSNVEGYRPWRQGIGRVGVLRVTGPIAYTQAIMPLSDDLPHRRIGNNSEIGLHYSISGEYVHKDHFKNHYSLRTDPIANVPFLLRPFSRLYCFLKQRQRKLLGVAADG